MRWAGQDLGSHLPATDLGRVRAPGTQVTWHGDLTAYREAVRDLMIEIEGSGHRGVRRAELILAGRLAEPEFATVLSATQGGMPEATERLLLEVRNYLPRPGGSAVGLTAMIRIYLLAQIEAMWWGHLPALVADRDVLSSADLVDLEPLRRRRLLAFQYRRQPRNLAIRAARAAERRLRPGRAPRTAGLRFTRARPEAVALLNQVSSAFATVCPPGTPPLWVTSLTRSIEHQHRLRALGYTATLPSSHCVGYAVDIEMSWFRRFGARRGLEALLLERQAGGDINVIDEGQVWHVCISPLAAPGLRDDFEMEMAG
jgi:hypothetical protein